MTKVVVHVREQTVSLACCGEELKEEISLFYQRFNKIICPHTAAGTRIGRKYLYKDPETPMVTLATAHPSKFNDVINKLLNIQVEVPIKLKSLLNLEEAFDVLSSDTDQLKKLILERKFSDDCHPYP